MSGEETGFELPRGTCGDAEEDRRRCAWSDVWSRESGFVRVVGVQGFSSDFLYQRWYRCHLDVTHFTPDTKMADRAIKKISAAEMNAEIFTERFERTRLPVCLIDIPEFSKGEIVLWPERCTVFCGSDEMECSCFGAVLWG